MQEARLHEKILGRVAVDEKEPGGVGYWNRLHDLKPAVDFQEVIFCEGHLSFKEIIRASQSLPKNVRAKFHAQKSLSIVGSDSKYTAGSVVSKENGNQISNPQNLRLKRLIDVAVAFFFIVSFPIHFLFVRKPTRFFTNCFKVLTGRRTWVGYVVNEPSLPALRKAIIGCNGIPVSTVQQLPAESLQLADKLYARDYEPAQDLKLLWKTYRGLGA